MRICGNGSRDIIDYSLLLLGRLYICHMLKLPRAKLNMLGAIPNLNMSSYFSIIFVNGHAKDSRLSFASSIFLLYRSP